MSSETIIVYIDPNQLKKLTANKYNLYLAKKVEDKFTVIWQSKGPLPVAGHESYSYRNEFKIAVPSFQINWGSVTETDGAVSYTVGGKATKISLGQITTLEVDGLFTAPINGGAAGSVTIENNRQNYPNAILSDSSGNPIYVGTDAGMAPGETTLTPRDEYQLWFGAQQDTGSIIAKSISNIKIVTFDGDSPAQTVSFTSDGKWIDGKLPSAVHAIAAESMASGFGIAVLATMSVALTTIAVTYVANKLIDKFGDDLRPTDITVQTADKVVRINLAAKKEKFATTLDMRPYEKAVDAALMVALKDKDSGLAGESWTLSEPSLTVSF